jgi:hypothetical protein
MAVTSEILRSAQDDIGLVNGMTGLGAGDESSPGLGE